MEPQTRPPRVVMVVANRIDGDSRVQKAAQSMAEDGWDVHLVGFSVSGKEERYRQGDYTVHRCPLPDLAEPPGLRERVARLRFPLAYADAERAEEVPHRVRAARIDLEADDRERSRSRDDGILRTPRKVRRLGRKVERKWLERRAASTEKRVQFTGIEEGDLERLERRWWTTLLGDRAWKRLDLNATRIELALRMRILKLKPDLMHAHDPYPLGICVRAAARMKAKGSDVKIVYDAHEYVPGFDALGPDRLEALTRYERRYLPGADAVVTVSRPLAKLLQERHGLDREPSVVLNAPLAPDATRPDPGDIRTSCGIPDDVPLAVYSGWASPERQIEVIIEAARAVPELHLALIVSRHKNPYVQSLKALAKQYGMAGRVHFRGYVHYSDLPRFLSTADMGIHPMQTGPVNHEIALPNKFFEYSHARLPLIVSDVATMSAEVRRLGNGEVFASGDAASLAEAIRKVVAGKDRYRRAYRDPALLAEYSWEHQARQYTAVYEELLGPAPSRAAAPPAARDVLRERSGADAETPVVAVLDGGPDDEWTATAVRGLASLTEARTVVVCTDPDRTAAFADAVVPTGPVAAFLSTAAAVVLPGPGREEVLPPHLALALDAGVPAVLPATPAAERFCEARRVGQTARADDPASVAAAVKQLLADPDRVRHARARARIGSATPWPRISPDDAVRLGLGPVNSAGQLSALAKAVAWHYPDTGVEVVALDSRGVFDYPADEHFAPAKLDDPEFQRGRAAQVLGGYTHVLSDWAGPVLGRRSGRDVLGDLPSLRRAGVRTALLFHGSDVRDPDGHLARHEHSAYRNAPEDVLERLRTTAPRNREVARESGLPLFVTTLDLLDDLPEATWVPLTVDVDRWYSDLPVMERARPVVLHAPSKRWTKGSDEILPVLERLDAAGKIEFRLVEGLPPKEMRDLVRGADLVVDQIALGCYSTVAVEAMAAGRPALAYLHEATAERMGEEPPVVHATVPTLEEVVVSLCEDRDRARAIGAESLRFARRMHDGRAAAETLRPFLES
ncbi:glycosyltransferase [Glycomyces sp. NPDC047010]|uniref:glycosyltransferase n=1 Tax=Glycomyces sp. NPDC047010 TaxID=3155023 RepID=UPI0033ED0534